jgi:uncharacterized RDD family membrane protein YckC/ribosomal protein L40E
MEQKPLDDSSGDIQKQPEIILSSPTTGGISPAPSKICSNCGMVSPSSAVYCFKCGIKLSDVALLNKKICAGCHTPNAPAARYCYKCGLPLPEKLSSGNENQIQYAGFWMRLVAFLINGIILYILVSIVSVVVFLGRYGESAYSSLTSSLGSPEEVNNQYFWAFVGLACLTGFIVTIIYSAVSIGAWGRTIGKMALKLKVVKPDGSRVSYWRALGRSLAYYLNGFTLGLSFLMIAFTKNKRGLHDYIADTIVIKTD